MMAEKLTKQGLQNGGRLAVADSPYKETSPPGQNLPPNKKHPILGVELLEIGF